MTDVMTAYEKLARQARDILKERKEDEKIRIQVGSATCENAAGAVSVYEEFRKHIQASGREDDILLHRTGCTGRCSREPIVSVLEPQRIPVEYEFVDAERAHRIFTSHVLKGEPVREYTLNQSIPGKKTHEFFFCGSDRCGKLLHIDFKQLFQKKLAASEIAPERARVISANCFGLCADECVGTATHVMIRPSKVVYRISDEKDLDEIIENHIKLGQIVKHLLVNEQPISQRFFELYGDLSFFHYQTRLALRNSGIINPENINEYIHYRGFQAAAQVLHQNNPSELIEQIKKSNLRGRGGGGFSTGLKWSMAAENPAKEKYIICNADEGDPGAFMDRSMLEGDPFSIIEGMIIGGFAIGAQQGYIYVRAEYPLAIKRLQHAINVSREHGLLGENILGSDFNFELEIRLGAGAFVCGEETALINSIEGKRGQPDIRPPYPTESGLWGQPTVINNVETFANVAVIVLYGAEWFAQVGTPKSGGTKVFALAGKIKHTGLVEVPMGTTLREIVFDVGDGVPDGKELKAVQTGGPAGGCIPAKWLDTPVDFDTLSQVGSIMGSGGMIVMDEDDCMVDVAKFFLTFSQDESCGKCTPCREGTTRMLEILDKITNGNAKPEDLDKLERLASLVKKASLCGLGRAAPNPVLSTLKYFRDEYEAHVYRKSCPARKCTSLIYYEIDPDKCVGCTVCARNCPVTCISGKPKEWHVIDQDRCIKCGRCFQVCRFDAVKRM